jgi:hypothetical protein
MATIREALLSAPCEVQEFFLLRCDEGWHAGACEWLQVEVGQGLEERFDYALLRERAKRADDDPIREIERLQVSANGGPSTRECWSCGEVLLVQRVNCPSCGRTQGGI